MEKKDLIRMSNTGHHEYCATVIKVDNIVPIENSDHLATIEVNGLKTVVDKRFLHVGDVVIYISNECCITQGFLSANNMYSISNYTLNANAMDLISPDTKVAISVKMHGTSFIFANVKCNLLKDIPFYKRWWNRLIPWRFKNLRFVDTYVDYGELYSSRKVLKNSYDYYGNKNNYTTDEYGYFAEKLHGKIPQGITVYGEIVGFKPNSTTYEQKNYDYGCKPGEAKLMIYRMTLEDSKGRRQELNVDEIKAFTDSLKKRYPELSTCLIDIPILYIGKINDLLKLDVDDKWKENALAKLSSLKEFNMEKKEPLCVNNVPREGIVIRIMDDPRAEAFKLKCVKFLEREAKEIDTGNVDTEMANNKW